ncbi:glycogen synthase kinase-3 alpha isoform X1 [Drosophila albomicans]|uniref:Glycogen synthase kinase-3 alpha isoform X1 n=1 Tax=Drosophila albomicans TaxID=7291 RepID=A0A6P8W539_DROAB|nr:glycogen synthase kinase-3 alpha isoform X1 [Drosophila albomicans]
MAEESTNANLDLIPDGTIYIAKVLSGIGESPQFSLITVHEPINVGSFGNVYNALLNKSNRIVALKQVLHDPLNREVDVLNCLKDHCNIVQLYKNIHVNLGEPIQKYSLLALDRMPMSLQGYILEQKDRCMPLTYVRIIAYQMFRALAFVHSHGICHRDVKLNHLLIDPLTMNLRLGGFSNAFFIGQSQLADLRVTASSRLYRAPELFGSCAYYSTAVDVWSAGCVLAEIINSFPLFEHFDSDREQLLNCVLTLGTYGLEQAPRMKEASGVSKVIVETRPEWVLLLKTEVPNDLQELLNFCLLYDSDARISALGACAHCSFDELRLMEMMKKPMPNGVPLPPLFNFSSHEMSIDTSLSLLLLPLKIAEKEEKEKIIKTEED